MQYAPGWTAYFLPIWRVWQGLRFCSNQFGLHAKNSDFFGQH